MLERISWTIAKRAQPVRIISLEDLLANKRAAGRPQDLADAQRLEEVLRAPRRR